MTPLTILTDGDNCWPDLASKIEAGDVMAMRGGGELALLQGGMISGKSSVTLRLDLPDGKVLLYETSLAILETAVQAFRVKESMTQKGEA